MNWLRKISQISSPSDILMQMCTRKITVQQAIQQLATVEQRAICETAMALSTTWPDHIEELNAVSRTFGCNNPPPQQQQQQNKIENTEAPVIDEMVAGGLE